MKPESARAPFEGAQNGGLYQRTAIASVAVIQVRGDIDFREIVEIKKAIGAFLLADKKNVVLSLAQVDHVNYLSIGVLVGSLRLLRNVGGDLKLAGMQPQVRLIFQTVGLDQFFENYATVEEALESFNDEWLGVEETRPS